MKCPNCLKGDFFISHPYNLKKAGDTHKKCPKCELNYLREPGFYFGALYVAYGFGVMVFVAVYLLYNWFFPEVNVWYPIGVITLMSLLLGPYLYALSKITWLNIFVKKK